MSRRRAWLGVLFVLAACGGAATPPPPIAIEERQLAVIELPGSPDWLVSAFESVWVKKDDGDVTRLDPASGSILATIPADVTGPDLCQGIGATETAIWACSMRDVVPIDPETNEVGEPLAVRKIFAQGRLAVADGLIWILTGENGQTLEGWDVEAGDAAMSIDLGAACSDLGRGDAGSVWVVCPTANEVLRVNPETAAIDRIEVEEPGSVSVGPEAAWVANPDGAVRVDLGDLSTETIAMTPGPADQGGIWADASAVWVRTRTMFLIRIDPASRAIVERIDSEYGPGDVLGVDGSLWASASDDGVVVHLTGD